MASVWRLHDAAFRIGKTGNDHLSGPLRRTLSTPDEHLQARCFGPWNFCWIGPRLDLSRTRRRDDDADRPGQRHYAFGCRFAMEIFFAPRHHRRSRDWHFHLEGPDAFGTDLFLAAPRGNQARQGSSSLSGHGRVGRGRLERTWPRERAAETWVYPRASHRFYFFHHRRGIGFDCDTWRGDRFCFDCDLWDLHFGARA